MTLKLEFWLCRSAPMPILRKDHVTSTTESEHWSRPVLGYGLWWASTYSSKLALPLTGRVHTTSLYGKLHTLTELKLTWKGNWMPENSYPTSLPTFLFVKFSNLNSTPIHTYTHIYTFPYIRCVCLCVPLSLSIIKLQNSNFAWLELTDSLAVIYWRNWKTHWAMITINTIDKGQRSCICIQMLCPLEDTSLV